MTIQKQIKNKNQNKSQQKSKKICNINYPKLTLTFNKTSSFRMMLESLTALFKITMIKK